MNEPKRCAHTPEALAVYFSTRASCRVALEAGTHSRGITRLLKGLEQWI